MTGGTPGPDERLEGDPLVATALRQLPVPDHTPGFWERVDADLAGVGEPTGPAASPAAAAPAPVTSPPPAAPTPESDGDLRLVAVPSVVPPAMRRRSTVALATLAAAAVVVVAVAVATIVDRGPDAVDTAARGTTEDTDADPGVTAADPAGSELTGTTAAPADGYHRRDPGDPGDPGDPVDPGDGGTGTVMSAHEEPGSGTEAVTTFVVAIDEGDLDTAWDLLAPDSQAFWESEDRFAASGTELAEGWYGSFRRARNVDVTSRVLLPGDGRLGQGEVGVVTLDGVVALEGDARRRALDVPYRHDVATGAWQVDPWGGGRKPGVDAGGGPLIRFRSPEPAEAGLAPLDAGAAIEAEVPAWATLVAVAVDGIDLETVEDVRSGSVRVVPPAPFAPGVHRLTVMALGADGTVTASSILVLVR